MVDTDTVASRPRTDLKPRGIGGWIVVALIIVAIDQFTKWIAVRSMAFAERIPVIPGFFDWTLLYNRGAAFSFLAGADGWQRWFFTAIGIVAAVVIVRLLRSHRDQPVFCAGLTLILGGAIGNVIDRVLFGQVTDFILWYWRDWHWPAFNVADMAITGGATLLVHDEIRRWRAERRQRVASPTGSHR